MVELQGRNSSTLFSSTSQLNTPHEISENFLPLFLMGQKCQGILEVEHSSPRHFA